MKEGSQDEVAVLFICFRTIFSSLLREKKRWAREFIIVRVNEVKVKRGTSANNSVRAPEELRMSPQSLSHKNQ